MRAWIFKIQWSYFSDNFIRFVITSYWSVSSGFKWKHTNYFNRKDEFIMSTHRNRTHAAQKQLWGWKLPKNAFSFITCYIILESICLRGNAIILNVIPETIKGEDHKKKKKKILSVNFGMFIFFKLLNFQLKFYVSIDFCLFVYTCISFHSC